MGFLQDLFGTKKAKQDTNQGTPMPFSLQDIPEFQTLRQQVLSGLKGEVNSDPFSDLIPALQAERRATWQEQVKPELQANLGAAGLARSTAGQRDIGRSYAENERNLNLAAEQQRENNVMTRLNELARLQNMAFNLGGAEANQRNQAILNEQQRALNQIGFQTAKDNAAQQSAGLIASTVGSAIAPFLPAPLSGSGVVGGITSSLGNMSQNQQIGTIDQALKLFNQGNSQVQVSPSQKIGSVGELGASLGGINKSTAPINSLLRLLGLSK